MNWRSVSGRLLLTGTVVAGLGLLLAWEKGWLGLSQAGLPAAATAPAKAPRDEVAEGIAREFAKLPPRLRKIARHLADASGEEYRQRPPHEDGFLTDKRRTAFTHRQIEALDTADIAALAMGLHENSALEDLIGEFREALFFVWAARDPAAARAHVMQVAADHGYRSDDKDTWKKAGEDANTDNHIYVTRGHASVDPGAAWRILQEERGDPALIGFGDWRPSLEDIFRSYAAKSPEEGWGILLSQHDPIAQDWGLRGFADGAPAGQDWRQLGEEWKQALHDRGEEPNLYSRLRIAARWAMEDPDAALAWISGSGEIQDLRDRGNLIQLDDDFEALALPGLEESDGATDLKLALLKELYESQEYRVPETVELLRGLASGEQAGLAARFIQREIGQQFSPLNIALLQILPAIEEPALREALFLQIARAVPPRSADPFSGSGINWDEPNVCLDAVKELAGKLNLSDAVRAQAEAAFAEVAVKEAAVRGAEEAEASKR